MKRLTPIILIIYLSTTYLIAQTVGLDSWNILNIKYELNKKRIQL